MAIALGQPKARVARRLRSRLYGAWLWMRRLAQPTDEHHSPEEIEHAGARTPADGPADGPAGGDDDFEAFFQDHQRDIFGYLWRLTGEEQAARDLSQETFLRAWQQFAKVQRYDRPTAWLFRIATHLAIDHQRRRSSSSSVRARLEDASRATSDPALQAVERDAVREAMLALPLRQRTALTLRVIYGLSCEEIAATLGVSHVAARMTLSRAREQFRRRYTGEKGENR